MREFTNLAWPETPFGADQRPFGHHTDMLAACTVDWAARPGDGPLPVASAMVYLRVRRHGPARRIGEDTLSIGFRTAVVEDPAEVPDLLMLTDRALTRARRQAVILAGHLLRTELARMNTLSAVPLRGAAGVLAAWANRAMKQRGAAVMVDTGLEAGATGAELDMPLEPVPVRVPDCPACAADVARPAVARCLAVGLAAAVHTDRYTWEGTFRVAEAIERAGWDVLSRPDAGTCLADATRDGDGDGAGSPDTAGRLVARAAT